MTNKTQLGKTITLTAATGGVVSGTPVVVRSGTSGMIAVPIVSASAAATYEAEVEGVFTLPKTAGTGLTYAVGDKLYWNATTGKLTKTSTGNTLAGTAWAAAGATDTTASVKLQGI